MRNHMIRRRDGMTEQHRPKGLSSAISYQDSKAAFRWLEEAFGFEPLFVLLDADGHLAHSEMGHGDSVVMVGNEWSDDHRRSEEHTSELQSLMRISYADFCLKKKKKTQTNNSQY